MVESLKYIESAFLQLVRLGIGHSNIYLDEKIDWDAIKALAEQQGLLAIVLDGIEKLPESKRAPKELLIQWIGEVLKNYESCYTDYEKAIAELASFYHRHGIKMMVLKGYGLSLYWPTPQHRPCGDIDTWNFGKQDEADAILTKELGIPVDSSEHHHTVFCWMKYIVENHYDFLIVTASNYNSKIEPILKEQGQDDSHVANINGVEVYLPSPNLNALFLLRHMLNHFASMGISLRHLLDWGFFWKKEGRKVDKDWFLGVVRQYHMTTFFNIINAICVDDLGFGSGIFPTVQFNPIMKERVFKDTLFPEYDWAEAHRLGLTKRLVFKYKRWKAAAWKRELCYEGIDRSLFWRSVWMHIFKPKTI